MSGDRQCSRSVASLTHQCCTFQQIAARIMSSIVVSCVPIVEENIGDEKGFEHVQLGRGHHHRVQ
jgi:hypothetical protein